MEDFKIFYGIVVLSLQVELTLPSYITSLYSNMNLRVLVCGPIRHNRLQLHQVPILDLHEPCSLARVQYLVLS